MENRTPSILIVDDTNINVVILEKLLTKEGFEALTASCGRDARSLAKQHIPDIILLDIMMPEETGFETCIKLKSDPLTADIPVIFLSALEDVVSKVEGFNAGAVDYITKPFKKAEVLARIRRHLETRDKYRSTIDIQAKKLKQIRDAQNAILAKPQEFPAARFGVRYLPVLEAGGDFYDVFPLGGGVFGYFIADISGHDLHASFITSALKALITQNARNNSSPAETLDVMNRVLTHLLSDGEHLTACYARLDRAHRRLSIVSAAHPPLIYLQRDGRVECLRPQGDILGVFDPVCLDSIDVNADEGDRFFLFTDGLIEDFGEQIKTRESGMAELIEACAATAGMPMEQALTDIVDMIFRNGRIPKDDLVLLGVEV